MAMQTAPVDLSAFTPTQKAAYDNAAKLAGTPPPIAALPAVNSMPATSLGQNNTTYSSYFPTSTTSTGLAETASASKDSYLSTIAKQTDEAKATQEAQLTKAQSLFERLGLQSTKQADAYESSGLNASKVELDSLASQIETVGRSFDKRIETLQTTNPNGELASGITNDVARLQREKASTLADYAIVLNAKTRNFDTAKSVIDQKVAAETDDLKTQLDGLQFFYTQNENKLSENQKTLLNDKIDAANKEYDAAKELRTTIGDVQLAAAKNGAPVSVVQAIGKADSNESAISAAAGYLKAQDASSNFKLSSAQTSQLLSGGFNQADVAKLQADVAQYGIDQTVSGMSKTQQDLVRRAFAGSDAVAGITSDNTQFLTPEYFAGLFTEDQLKKAAADAGYRHYLTSWSTEKKNYLDHLTNVVAQYRLAGYTDQDILKMMQ